MALTRIEKALTIATDSAPKWFVHSPTPNKPTEPDVSSLNDQDADRYALWKAQRESGIAAGFEEKNVSPDLAAAMEDYNEYALSNAFQAWAALDKISRDAQWRLSLVDIMEAVNAKATIPITLDPLGVGTSAPSINDVGELGKPPVTLTPDYVTTGDPNAPELVFGDDGDIVTVQ
jgi:hypothetical protein